MTTIALVTGGVAGVGMGYVLQRAQLCFHATFSGALARRFLLARGWLLGVAISSVGLSVLFLTPLGDGLNRGLPFAPVADVVGGVVIGVGMAVAATCVSGLFFKLGSGMLGCLAGLGGWAAGELAARQVVLPGPTVLPAGAGATFPALLGVPRLAFAVVFLAVVGVVLWRWRAAERPRPGQWDWPVTGVALGAVTIAGWVLAGVGGAGFGPSTVGAVAGFAAGAPNWWLTAFLLGIVVGAAVAARVSGEFHVRGERPVRYVRLVAGGFLLGAGGWIAGGCNLGHGLSGVAQLNVASWVVVAAIVAGIALARAVNRAATAGPPGAAR
ncbi:YeeE/YedE family protein [Amycolatopsis sp. NBC_00348]|uniref:YeeE/YedE thiosulfate transporter family protein n=1 Tax=Amycolatopsis sp. NBC_00348 TaxID=2975956 RepID=UPI002E25E3CC